MKSTIQHIELSHGPSIFMVNTMPSPSCENLGPCAVLQTVTDLQLVEAPVEAGRAAPSFGAPGGCWNEG